MAKHEELLSEGPRTAPEPETAEERSHLRNRGALGGLLAVGGIGALKLGVFTKFFIWLAAWHGAIALLRLAGWPGLVVGVAALAIVVAVIGRSQRARFHRRSAERDVASEPQGTSR